MFLTWWRRPIISLQVGTTNPFLTDARVDGNFKGFCYHALVQNIGKSTAKKCQAELCEIWTEVPTQKGKFYERKNHIPTQLQWALGGRLIDIYMKGKKYIDLGYIKIGQQNVSDVEYFRIYFHKISTGGMPDGVVHTLESGLKHRIMITIIGDNFSPEKEHWLEIFIPLSCHKPSSDFKQVSIESYVKKSEKPSGCLVLEEEHHV